VVVAPPHLLTNVPLVPATTAGSGEYLLYATPTRLGAVTFFFGGFEGGMLSPETVSITNINGSVEDYLVYRSANPNLGVTSLVVV